MIGAHWANFFVRRLMPVMFELWKLKRKIRSVQRAYAKDRAKLEKKKAPREELDQLEASEFYEVREIEKEIEKIEGGRLWRQARHLDVETPRPTEKEMWIEEFGSLWFSPKGRAYVRKLVDEEKARRFEVKSRWVAKIIIPLLSLLVGIIGAITGLVAVLLHRK